MRVLVIGDVLLDQDVDGSTTRIAPDAPVPVVDVAVVRERPGGAGLAALLAARDGVEVVLAAVDGADAAGGRLRALLREAGVRPLTLARVTGPGQAGTRVVTRVRSGRQCLLRLDTAGAVIDPRRRLDEAALAQEFASADAVLVADYGAGTCAHPAVLRALATRRPDLPVVWDPHLRGAAPPPDLTLLTPNRAEAAVLAAGPDDDVLGEAQPAHLAQVLRRRWRAAAVAVTAGEDGVYAALRRRQVVHVQPPLRSAGDPVGAGDRFAGTAAIALAGGATIPDALRLAVHDVAGWLDRGGVDALREAHAARVLALPSPLPSHPPSPLPSHLPRTTDPTDRPAELKENLR